MHGGETTDNIAHPNSGSLRKRPALRWPGIRDHIRTDLQSRPGVYRIANPLDSRIVGELLVVLTQLLQPYRTRDSATATEPTAGDDAKVRKH